MTKVLEVIYGFGYGGIRAFIMNCLSHFDRTKFQIDIYVFGFDSSPFTNQVISLGANIYFEPENIDNRAISRFVGKLESFMKEHGPYDVCHAHCNLISAWVLLAAKRAKIPIRLSHSHSTSHFNGGLKQKVYSFIRLGLINYLATSKLACGQLAGEKMYGKKSKFIVIRNGIDIQKYFEYNKEVVVSLREKWDIPCNAKIYANISRLDNNKNHVFVIDVFEEIAKGDSNAYLLIGGNSCLIDSSEEVVKNRIKGSLYKSRIRLIGPQMDMASLYHITDCWIYPSHHEGLPFGPVELQAASTPCIVSDVVTKEIDLGLGLIHFVSLEDSPKKWAEIATSIKKEQIEKRVIKNAFETYAFDIIQIVKNLEKIYIGQMR